MKNYAAELNALATQISALRNEIIRDSKIPTNQRKLFEAVNDIESRLFFIEMEAHSLRELVHKAGMVDDAKKFVQWVRTTEGTVPNVLKLPNGVTVYATPGDYDYLTIDLWKNDIHYGGITVSPGDDEKIKKFYNEIMENKNK